MVNRLKTKCITKLDMNKNLTRSLPLEHRPGAGTRSSLCDRAAGEWRPVLALMIACVHYRQLVVVVIQVPIKLTMIFFKIISLTLTSKSRKCIHLWVTVNGNMSTTAAGSRHWPFLVWKSPPRRITLPVFPLSSLSQFSLSRWRVLNIHVQMQM